MAHIICLQEVSGKWFQQAYTALGIEWYGWMYDGVGFIWNTHVLRPLGEPTHQRIFPGPTNKYKVHRFFCQAVHVSD